MVFTYCDLSPKDLCYLHGHSLAQLKSYKKNVITSMIQLPYIAICCRLKQQVPSENSQFWCSWIAPYSRQADAFSRMSEYTGPSWIWRLASHTVSDMGGAGRRRLSEFLSFLPFHYNSRGKIYQYSIQVARYRPAAWRCLARRPCKCFAGAYRRILFEDDHTECLLHHILHKLNLIWLWSWQGRGRHVHW